MGDEIQVPQFRSVDQHSGDVAVDPADYARLKGLEAHYNDRFGEVLADNARLRKENKLLARRLKAVERELEALKETP